MSTVSKEQIEEFMTYLNSLRPSKPIEIYYKNEKYPPGIFWTLVKFITTLLGYVIPGFKYRWDNNISNTGGGVFLFPNREIYSDLTNPKVFAIYRHETVHYRDELDYGSFLFKLHYTLLPFPILWAYYRAYFEFRGYAQNLITHYEVYGEWDDALEQRCKDHFKGYLYGWMWPWNGRVDRAFENLKSGVLSGSISGYHPPLDF